MWKYDKRSKCVKKKDGYWVDAESFLAEPQDWINHLRDKSWWNYGVEQNFYEEMEKCIADHKKDKAKKREKKHKGQSRP